MWHTSVVGFGVRRTDAYGPWRGGLPEPCVRPRSPCGREIRADACGPAWTVDTCASRLISETTVRSGCEEPDHVMHRDGCALRRPVVRGGLYGRRPDASIIAPRHHAPDRSSGAIAAESAGPRRRNQAVRTPSASACLALPPVSRRRQTWAGESAVKPPPISSPQRYTVATGVAGEPTAPGSRSGGAVSRNRLRPLARSQSANSVRYHISPR